MSTKLNTIQAQEIKRRGISSVDEKLKDGPVHVVKNNEPKYVILGEEQYSDIIAEQEESYEARLRESLEDMKAGRVHSFISVEELMRAIKNTVD